MIYGSVCSGIEAATVAWKPLGWKAAFFSEIEKFPGAVLAHHYPDVPNLGDMTNFKEWPDAKLDVLVGGTPCQSFSIAGLRKGLDDPRGNLMLTYLAIAAKYRPKWLVWENVPGVLSSNGGKDFGTLLGGLGELGYGFAYRILDAQYAGVPQRRRRVFVVGHLGNWRRAAAVLFEQHSLQGNPAPSREKGEDVAGTIAASSFSGGAGGRPEGAAAGHFITGALTARGGQNGGQANDDVDGNKLICVSTGQAGAEIATNMAPTLNCNHEAPYIAHSYALQHTQIGRKDSAGPQGKGWQQDVSFTLDSRPCADAIAFSNRGVDTNGATETLRAGCHGALPMVAFAQNQRDEVRMMHVAGALAAEPGMKQQTYIATPINTQMATRGPDTSNSSREGVGVGAPGDPAFTLQSAHSHAIQSGMQVRRLTPRECERLQGFPDDYSLIPGKAPDGPRYKALGNSMAVPVMRWIGERIDAVEMITESLGKEVA